MMGILSCCKQWRGKFPLGESCHLGTNEISWKLLALLALILAITQSVADDTADKRPCGPRDYKRVASECAEGRRKVEFEHPEYCQDVLAAAKVDVNCNCSIFDYEPEYKKGVANNCRMRYKPAGDCLFGATSDWAEVPAARCEAGPVACGPQHIMHTYTQCDRSAGDPRMQVIYYFSEDCNPDLPSSVSLPPPMSVSCELQCGPGYYRHHGSCQLCEPGTFSFGNGKRWLAFEDLKDFETKCQYTDTMGEVRACPSTSEWRAERGVLKVGQFDPPNIDVSEFAPDLHNYVLAVLTMKVLLVSAGRIKFNYTVNAEHDCDGLSFYIDDEQNASLPLTSYKMNGQEEFPLAAGYRVLRWQYTKDESFSLGSDSASINWMEITGTDMLDRTCDVCPAGFFSSMAGSDSCTSCPVNFVTASDGSTKCDPCLNDTYSLEIPRTKCLPMRACLLAEDAAFTAGPCGADGKITKTFYWLDPKVCKETEDPATHLPDPVTEDCEPCPAGQVPEVSGDTRLCTICPPGLARAADEAECHACDEGQVAVKLYNYTHILASTGAFPHGFTTGCTGDCGTPGWRVAGDFIDSGLGHGNLVEVWLELNVTLEMDGYVEVIYRIDIEALDDSETFTFSIDTYSDTAPEHERINEFTSVVGERQKLRRPLTRGPHSLRWTYSMRRLKETFYEVDDPRVLDTQRDAVEIFGIVIWGSSEGGAPACEPIPVGYRASADGTWEPCPAGTYGGGGNNNCTECPGGTYRALPGGGVLGDCLRCLSGTTSRPGATDCFIGDVEQQVSECSFTPKLSHKGHEFIVYDLLPLALQRPGQPYGPVYDTLEPGGAFWISVCGRMMDNRTCYNTDQESLNSYACMWGPQNSPQGPRVVRSLGDTVMLLPLGEGLERRGLVMQFQGGRCPTTSTPRVLSLFLICDPSAGYGQPEAWTSRGYHVATDPKAPFPWTVRGGDQQPVQRDQAGCTFSLVWYTSYACPLCNEPDYEEKVLRDCENGMRTVWHPKPPKMCMENPYSAHPPGKPCAACKESDYVTDVGPCVDLEGNRNITYRWLDPKLCDEDAEGAAPLPKVQLAGLCHQNITVMMGSPMGPYGYATEFWVLLFVAAIIISLLAAAAVVAWMRSSRLYAQYAKLASATDGDMELAAAAHKA